MTKRKHSIKSESSLVANYSWTDDYSPAFKPDNKNLYSLHKVPQFKRRFASD